MTDGDVAGMTDLEQRLKGENAFAERATILSRLRHLEGVLDDRVRRGLRPEEFARATAIQAAVRAAHSILDALALTNLQLKD